MTAATTVSCSEYESAMSFIAFCSKANKKAASFW